MIISFVLLIIPFAIVGLSKKRPILTLIIAAMLASLILIIPALFQIFQGMMIYGVADPELMAGRISQVLTRSAFIMFLVVPLLLAFQTVMRERRQVKANEKAAPESFE